MSKIPIDLIEESILVFLLPQWETDVKGLYWVMKRKKGKQNRPDESGRQM